MKAGLRIALAAVAAALAACAIVVLGVPAVGGAASAATRPTTSAPSSAGTPAGGAPHSNAARHVVIVGIPGLRWTDVSVSATPALWQVAGNGSVGSLVDYAVVPRTCPADGWLTLNAGGRAMVPHTDAAPCPPLPAVVSHRADHGAAVTARIPAMPSLVTYNRRFHYGPHWGLLASAAGSRGCATAVGPGAALALAGPAGRVGAYLPSASALTRRVLARCPLTVVDLGALPSTRGPTRAAALHRVDAGLAAIDAELPVGATLLVTAPGANGKAHLRTTVIDGPGYRNGLLAAASTRQPGIVVLTDLTPTVLGWLGRPVPAGTVGARITRTGRTDLAAAVHDLIGQDTAAQVWASTHIPFLLAYALAEVAVLAGIGLLLWGGQPDRRRRRAAAWRVAGVFAGAVPAGTFLASLVPWWLLPHPAFWLYGLAAGWTVVVGVVALAGPWRRSPLGPAGMVAAVTVAVVGLDAMTGYRLQTNTPFGNPVLAANRYYGIGNQVVGGYAVCGLLAATWLAVAALRRGRRGTALLVAAAVAAFASIACGWPGFGAKVGGTIAMVPGFVILLMAIAGVKINSRRVALALASGVALFAVFALVNYLLPATGRSDIGAFAGDLLHGRAGGLLTRKVTSMLGSLAIGGYSPLVPLLLVAAGLALLRPSWFAIKALPRAYRAEPLLRVTLAVMWLVAVIGWFADDSGIIVPAAALPLALPLTISLLAAIPSPGFRAGAADRDGPAVTDPSVAGKF